MIKKSRNLGELTALALFKPGRLARDERGVTLVEFALLALPFFAIVGAILETSLVFLASQVLDSAVEDSARLIRTGQAQSQNYTEAEFRSAICNGLYSMFDCTGLKVKVSEIATFAAATLNPVADITDGSWTLIETYEDGVGSSIVLVEAYYKWPIVLNIFDFNLANLPDNTRMLSSVRLFRNEPF